MAGQGKKTSAEVRRERAAAARAAAATERRRRRIQIIAAGLAVVLVVGAVSISAVLIGGLDGAEDAATSLGDTADDPTAPPGAPAGQAICTYVPASDISPADNVGPPPGFADNSKPYYATVELNRGAVTMELDAESAPCAVNSFMHLAEEDFYADSPCHRELNAPGNYVLQCGDPTGTGMGGPGYGFPDENLQGATYEEGVVALANSGPNTNGSQFFMMFDDSGFAPSYVPFGKIISGIDVLKKIGDAGVTGPKNDEPKVKVTIEKVTISGTKPKA